MEEAAVEYSKYFKTNSESELETLQSLVDSMLTRVEEFGSILNVVKAEGKHCITEIVPQLESYRGEVNSITKRIDSLESFLGRVNSDLDNLERDVQKAEEAFRGPSTDKKIKNLFKPFLGIKEKSPIVTEVVPSKESYQPSATFRASDYFYGDADETSS